MNLRVRFLKIAKIKNCLNKIKFSAKTLLFTLAKISTYTACPTSNKTLHKRFFLFKSMLFFAMNNHTVRGNDNELAKHLGKIFFSRRNGSIRIKLEKTFVK